MKKTKKGLTLVEVLVAITVLSITMFALLSTIVAMRKVVSRQEEYVKIKMVCQDIEAYWDKYGLGEGEAEGWAYYYFKGEGAIESYTGYLTSKFSPVRVYNKSHYKIEYRITESNELVIKSITSPDKKILVENLNCGTRGGVTDEQE